MLLRPKKLWIGAVIFGALLALFGAPASPAAAAYPVCTEAWRMYSSPTGTTINFVPQPATTVAGYGILNCELRKGNTGIGVRALQQSLNTCYGFGLSIDGQFGSNTDSAVRTMQGRVHVGVDGIVGPQTLYAMSYLWGTAPSTSSPCLGYHATGQNFRGTVQQA